MSATQIGHLKKVFPVQWVTRMSTTHLGHIKKLYPVQWVTRMSTTHLGRTKKSVSCPVGDQNEYHSFRPHEKSVSCPSYIGLHCLCIKLRLEKRATTVPEISKYGRVLVFYRFIKCW